MLSIRDTLLWYKRPEVRQAMVVGAKSKEIGIRYGDGFGKRPDSLEYEQEVLAAVQRGATSFHASEELWNNPRLIETGMSKQAANDLRTGWDLVLDIDFTSFPATKLITQALCRELEQHGVYSYGLKFSGNKGFHIGVPWESFPATFNGQPLAAQFPDAARVIANYLVFCIDNPENGFALSEQLRTILSLHEAEKHLKRVCAGCGRDRSEKKFEQIYVCTRCHHHENRPADFDDVLVCPKCNSIMDKLEHNKAASEKCVCGSTETRQVFDLKIDTQLVASRHLYRLEYSLHEKSGLVSLPISPSRLLTFERDEATPDLITAFPPFWNREAVMEGYQLLISSQVFAVPDSKDNFVAREVVWDGDAAPEEAFPPTIQKMLAGMHDGKKRALFILTNFLRSIGWNYDMIDVTLREWNAKNDPPLREQELVGHLRYHKQRGTTVLPPNFENDVYKDLGVLVHDALSEKTKNPVQYVKMKMKQAGVQKKE
jgi:hypothetical protein